MTDTKQFEALRLAEFFETDSSSTFAEFRAANELRRLHEVNQELLNTLKLAQAIIGHPDDQGSKFILAAIVKAEGGSK